MQGRAFHLIYGNENDYLSQMKILMVGVGGIGCEILKVVCKFQVKEFHIIDMDTIEVSNLNRQFLFKSIHRGQAKSTIAKLTMQQMAPQLNIIAHVGALGQGEYRLKFLSQFDLVIMALDNQDTRSYVNKVCRALGTFLLDAGSMGFKGQSAQYNIAKDLACYDCLSRSTTQKQYPACTIRQQPTTCVHCVIWGKYLFTQLFGPALENDDSGILEFATIQRHNSEEVFKLFFQDDIERLKRSPSNLEKYDHLPIPPTNPIELTFNPEERILIALWFSTFLQLQNQKQRLGTVEFEKDEWSHTAFIYSSALLRCQNFGIAPQRFSEVKTICGNIIHAIASTNSIVAAIEVSKMLLSLFESKSTGETFLSHGKRERLVSVKQQKRLPSCTSCLEKQILLEIDINQISMGQLVSCFREQFIDANQTQISFQEKARIIWDDEDEDQCETMQMKPLKELFNTQLDNRLIVSVEEKNEYILWIIHHEGQNKIEFKTTIIQRNFFKLKQEEERKRYIRNQSQNDIPLIIPCAIMCLDDSDEENKQITNTKQNEKKINKNDKNPQEIISLDSE